MARDSWRLTPAEWEAAATGGGVGIGLFFAIAGFTGGEGPGEIMFAVVVPLFFLAQAVALEAAFASGGLLADLCGLLEPATPALAALQWAAVAVVLRRYWGKKGLAKAVLAVAALHLAASLVAMTFVAR